MKMRGRRPIGDNTRALKTRACRASDTAIGNWLVHAHGLQFVAPGVRDRGFTRIGQHDRRAVGGVKRKELHARREVRRLREKPGHVLGADLLHIGDMTLAEMGQRLRRDARIVHNITFSHGLDSSET